MSVWDETCEVAVGACKRYCGECSRGVAVGAKDQRL